jgi:hypothetical protein
MSDENAPTFDEIATDLMRQSKRIKEAKGVDLKNELLNNIIPMMGLMLQATAARVEGIEEILDEDPGEIPADLVEAMDGSLKIGLALCALLEKEEITDEDRKDLPATIAAYREIAQKISESFEDAEDDDEDDDE